MDSTDPPKATLPKVTLEDKLEQVRRQVQSLESALGGTDPQEIIDSHIKLLHEYNEVRDAAHILVGKLASLERCTIREMYASLGINPDD